MKFKESMLSRVVGAPVKWGLKNNIYFCLLSIPFWALFLIVGIPTSIVCDAFLTTIRCIHDT